MIKPKTSRAFHKFYEEMTLSRSLSLRRQDKRFCRISRITDKNFSLLLQAKFTLTVHCVRPNNFFFHVENFQHLLKCRNIIRFLVYFFLLEYQAAFNHICSYYLQCRVCFSAFTVCTSTNLCFLYGVDLLFRKNIYCIFFTPFECSIFIRACW